MEYGVGEEIREKGYFMRLGWMELQESCSGNGLNWLLRTGIPEA
jgi:hypothetical protein